MEEYLEQPFRHPRYYHEPMSRYNDTHQAYLGHPHGPMIAMPTKTNETKPRLGKDEVDILEREFKKNPKPTTQTKRLFAEEMRVELARINNWFQNRRAKRKQEKKQEAYDAGHAQEALGAYSEPSSPDFYNNSSNIDGYFGDSQMEAMQQQPANAFSIDGPPLSVATYNPPYTDPSSASMESLQRTMVAAQTASEDNFHPFAEHNDTSLPTFGPATIHDFSSGDRAPFPAPEETGTRFDCHDQFSYTESDFSSNFYHDPSQPILDMQQHVSSQDTAHQTPTPFDSFSAISARDAAAQAATFPSQLLPSSSNDSNFSQSPESHSLSIDLGFKYEISEGNESSLSPPGPSIPFKSPPAMNIASRRKVQHRPATLSTGLQSRPSMGPRTVSHAEGFRRSTESPSSSPMRRIVSAGGNRNGNVLSGRVYKSGSIESSQRSPINLGGFNDANTFLEHNYQNIRNPSLTPGTSLTSSLAPPTPLSPRERQMTFPPREEHRMAASPVDAAGHYIFDGAAPACFVADGEHKTLQSPPETPHAQFMFSPSNVWTTAPEYRDKAWQQYDIADEPQYTPGVEQFPLEIHQPQPSYVSAMGSQPVTPAFGNFNPNFIFGHDSPSYMLSTQTRAEYRFPDAHPYSLGASPNTTKQKTFQFSHTTAADFSEK